MVWQVSQRQWSEAKQLLSQALEGLDTLLGPQHVYCISAAEVLWRLCRRSGDLQQAELLLSRLSAAASSSSAPDPAPASRGFYTLREDDFSGPEEEEEEEEEGDDEDQFGVREDSITMTMSRGRGRSGKSHEEEPQSQEDEDDDDDDEEGDRDRGRDEEVPPSRGSALSALSSRPAERRGRAAKDGEGEAGRRPTLRGAQAQAQAAVRARTFTSYRR